MALAFLLAPAGYGATQEPAAPADPDEPPQRASPWLVSPLLSVDPKLGRNLGGMAAYLHRFDDASPVSMVGVGATYSNTDSLVGGLFGDLYWGEDHHRLTAGLVYGDINNEYDDFLGTGLTVDTVDQLQSIFLRYRYRVWGNWFAGAQFVRTNYAIDFPQPKHSSMSRLAIWGLIRPGWVWFWRETPATTFATPTAVAISCWTPSITKAVKPIPARWMRGDSG